MQFVTDAVRLFRNTREAIAPVLTQSAFLERGVLTPEEFVRAGDQLVSCCPSWQWAEGEPGKVRPYLPRDKQFLITRGVPSYRRCAQMSRSVELGSGVEGEADWEAPTLQQTDYDSEEEVLVDATDASDAQEEGAPQHIVKQAAAVEEEDEYADMEDESLALDEATLKSPHREGTIVKAIGDGDSCIPVLSKPSGIVRSRRYDVSMTYDKYYQTPRIWLFGYDETGSPLSPEAVFQDVMQDYANKTVTIDPHPHLHPECASIHPCQHASAMLKIIGTISDCGKVPTVDQYLFIFLKFIQSVVPTIEYDFTMDVQVSRADGGP